MAKDFELKSDLSVGTRAEIDRIQALPTSQRNATETAFLTNLAPYLTNEAPLYDANWRRISLGSVY